MEYNIEHNEAMSRFEVVIDNLTSVVDYLVKEDGNIDIIHTGVPSELEGRGIAAALTKAVLQYARENEIKIYPSCPYTKAYIERHPEYESLLAE